MKIDHTHRAGLLLLILFVSTLIAPRTALGVWRMGGNHLLPVSDAHNSNARGVYPSGDGGVIAVGVLHTYQLHRDQRFGPIAQRVDTDGELDWAWDVHDLRVGWVDEVTFCSDGEGGFIIAYVPGYLDSYDLEPIRVERYGPDGELVWSVEPLGPDLSDVSLKLLPSYDGGAYLRWIERREGQLPVWKVRRLDFQGQWSWTFPPAMIRPDVTSEKFITDFVQPGHGYTGVWVTDPPTVEAVRISKDGDHAWGDGRVIVEDRWATTLDDMNVRVFPGTVGDFHILYTVSSGIDFYDETRYLQRVGSDGAALWGPKGVVWAQRRGIYEPPVESPAVMAHTPLEGGGIAFGLEYRVATYTYARRGLRLLDGQGEVLRNPIFTADEWGTISDIASDGSGGLYVIQGNWFQHLDADWNPLLPGNGLEVRPGTLISTAPGQPLVHWQPHWDGRERLGIKPFQRFDVYVPDGGESWSADSVQEVRWTTPGYDRVDIDVSYDGGASWAPIAWNVADTGVYRWTIPDLTTFEASVRIRPDDRTELETASRSAFWVRPRGEAFGAPAGEIFLSFDETKRVQWAQLAPLTPFDFYLQARLDSTRWASGSPDSQQGILGWEASIDLPPEVLVTQRTLVDPLALNVNSETDSWVVGTGHPIAVGQQPETLLHYRAVLLESAGQNLAIGLDGVGGSSFETVGGPGSVPGWAAAQPTGECPNACLRMFDPRWRSAGLLLQPTTSYSQPLRLSMSRIAVEAGERFEFPLLASVHDLGPLPRPQDLERLELAVEWDPTVIEVEDVVAADASLAAAVDAEITPGLATIVVQPSQPISRESILDLEFVIHGQARLRDAITDVTFVEGQANDSHGDFVGLDFRHGSVETQCVDPDCRGVGVAVSGFTARQVDGAVRLQWTSTLPTESLRLVGRCETSSWTVPIPAAEGLECDVLDRPPVERGRLEYRLIVDSSVASPSEAAVARASLQFEAPRTDLALLAPVTLGAGRGIRLGFRLDRARSVILTVYGIDGRRVREVTRADFGPGTHEVVWNGQDDRGQSVATGVYLLRMQANGDERTTKVLLLD